MADRSNQAYPISEPQPQFFSPQGVAQNKSPAVAPNGPFPANAPFPSGPLVSGQGSLGHQTGAPPRPPADVNGFSSQQRMPTTSPVGYPPVPPSAGHLAQMPPGVLAQRPQFPPPPSLAGQLVNGPGIMSSRPPTPSNLPPTVRTGAPPSSYQGTSTFHGLAPGPQSGEPPKPSAQPVPPGSNVGQAVSSAHFTSGIHGSAGDSVSSRPNELPVPFHGQGQYSHQVNPFMQKTPTQTPSNSEPPSERSSRGPSPVSGSTMDALEGQFMPGHGAPSPAFPGSRSSPLPGHVPPATATETFTPPPQGYLSPQTAGQQAQGSPAFASPNQQLPSRPGFPPRPPVGLPHQQAAGLPGQFQPQHSALYQGQRPPFATAGSPHSTPGPPPSATGPLGGAPPSSLPRYPQPNVTNKPSGFPPLPPSSSTAGFPSSPSSTASGFPPPSSTASGYPPPPSNTAAGFQPPSNVPGFTPYPGLPGTLPPPPTAGSSPVPLPASQMVGPRPGAPPVSQFGSLPPTSVPGAYPTPQYGQVGAPLTGSGMYPGDTTALTQNLANMGIQDTQRVINLLTERHLISSDGIETAKSILGQDLRRANCSPDVFRCTLNAMPQNSALLNKARLPLGILIHPFRDLSQLPVIQSSVIVRCRSCRTYINPFVVFVDQRRWKCNLCYRVNDLPDEFSFDPVSKTYGDPQRRPEVKSATIEFIAPSEYMLRPPQPAVYLYLLDVSFGAVETGYLSQFCQILLDELDKLPGDARTSIGFLCYDSSLYYFNLAEGLSQPQMLCVPDLEDPFLPCPDSLLVNLHESKELVTDLLNQLPNLFQGNLETGSALGSALQAAYKLMNPTGGRITVMQTCLPTVGAGALQNREAANTAGKNTLCIGPATDFYKKLSLDCSAQQTAVDLFMFNGQYADIATLSCISKYSAGCIYYYPAFHTLKNPGLVDKFDTDFRRYLTRKIGFEAVMRIRCTRGLSIHTFHGNFFVRSTDLLSLPNINPDAGFGMQMSIEDNLVESSSVSFQAALLYTSSKGERRIRVHTLCVPVTNQLSDVFACADQQAIAALLTKMAVDRSLNSSLADARDAMMNASLDALMAYGQQIPASQRVGTLLAPNSLRLMPMFMLSMLKHFAFSLASNTKVDDRVFAMQQYKVLPVCFLIQKLYPHLYPLHKLSNEKTITHGKEKVPSAPLLQLSSANIDRTGLFLMDTGEAMYLLVGSGVGDQLCQEVFDKQNFMSIPEDMMDLPELENPTSERIRSFINFLMDTRPFGVTFLVIRDDSKHRFLFFQHMLEDRTESSMSYYEFLQFLQGKYKG